MGLSSAQCWLSVSLSALLAIEILWCGPNRAFPELFTSRTQHAPQVKPHTEYQSWAIMQSVLSPIYHIIAHGYLCFHFERQLLAFVWFIVILDFPLFAERHHWIANLLFDTLAGITSLCNNHYQDKETNFWGRHRAYLSLPLRKWSRWKAHAVTQTTAPSWLLRIWTARTSFIHGQTSMTSIADWW